MTGRDDVFRNLYDQHFQQVVGHLVRLGMDRQDAQEIAQEAFMRVYDNMDDIRDPVGCVYTTARNLAHNKRRDDHAQKRNVIRVPLDGVDAPSQTQSAEAELIERQKQQRLRAAIAELPKGTRQALQVRLQGHSYKEVATILGISVDAVKSRLHEATVRLRERLGEEPPSGIADSGSERDG